MKGWPIVDVVLAGARRDAAREIVPAAPDALPKNGYVSPRTHLKSPAGLETDQKDDALSRLMAAGLPLIQVFPKDFVDGVQEVIDCAV